MGEIKLWAIGIVTFIVIIVGIYFHFDIGGYDVGCLDNIADSYCQEHHLTDGQARRGGLGLDRYAYSGQPIIVCFGDVCNPLRDGACSKPSKLFNYLQSELDKCKKK